MATVHLPNGRTDSYTTQVGGTVLAFVDGVANVDALPEGVARFLKINGYEVTAAEADAKEPAPVTDDDGPDGPTKADAEADAEAKPKATRTKPADK